jgi:hypothetical protein
LQSIPSRPTPQDRFSTCPNPLPEAGQALLQRHESSGVAFKPHIRGTLPIQTRPKEPKLSPQTIPKQPAPAAERAA